MYTRARTYRNSIGSRVKVVLEIDGNIDAWGNRWRMESGSVLFLVKSNFKHFYSDKLVDGVHTTSIYLKICTIWLRKQRL